MSKKKHALAEVWKYDADEKDFHGALSYLSLIVRPETAERMVAGLRAAGFVEVKARDVLRGSRLALLPQEDTLVGAELKKIRRGEPLSPVLLVRGDLLTGNRALEIADGYHRLCASYHLDENAEVRCRIVDP